MLKDEVGGCWRVHHTLADNFAAGPMAGAVEICPSNFLWARRGIFMAVLKSTWDSLPGEALVSLKTLLDVLSISKSKAYELMATDPDFPMPVYIGDPSKRCKIGFRKFSILKYIAILEERSQRRNNAASKKQKTAN